MSQCSSGPQPSVPARPHLMHVVQGVQPIPALPAKNHLRHGVGVGWEQGATHLHRLVKALAHMQVASDASNEELSVGRPAGWLMDYARGCC